MIEYILHQHLGHLSEIISLQNANLKTNLSDDIREIQGFVTLTHSVEMLEKMSGRFKHVCAVENGKIIGYALITLPTEIEVVPALQHMVHKVEKIIIAGQNLRKTDYLIMGQICIDYEYRGQGVFDGMYEFIRTNYAKEIPFIITEISVSNKRSLKAHARVGFREIGRHINELDEWIIVVWSWTEPE